MKRILVVENDLFLLETLSRTLRKTGIKLLTTKSLFGAFRILRQQAVDMVITDRILDDGDGLEIVQFLVDSQATTRTLVLTQKRSLDDRIQGLQYGADDYLGKPFSIEELNLRVTKLLFMTKSFEENLLLDGETSLCLNDGELSIQQQKISLTPTELRIMECLFRSKNTVVSRSQLLITVWGYTENVPSLKSLDVYIRRIRTKLGKRRYLLKTKRGFGYMIVTRSEE